MKVKTSAPILVGATSKSKYRRYFVMTDINFQYNTYQAVILTNGNETFTITNYHTVNWMGSASTGDYQCNPETGTNEDYPNCFLAQVSRKYVSYCGAIRNIRGIEF